MTKLDGYKTYIVAAVMVAVAVYLNVTDQIDSERMIALVLQGLGLAGLRHAVAKAEP